MSDTVVRLDFFPAEFTVAHEHHVRGNAPGGVVYYPGARRDGGHDGIWLRVDAGVGDAWTGVFCTEFVARLRLVASWPDPRRLFVAAGGAPFVVTCDDPDDWEQLPVALPRRLEPLPDLGLALLLDPLGVTAYDARGPRWFAPLGDPAAVWLGRIGGEVFLRTHGTQRVTVDLAEGALRVEDEPR